MKKNRIYLAAALVLAAILGTGVWSFVRGVSGQLWATSIRTITETTHQGAMTLNLQFEADFDMLEVIRESLDQAGTSQLEDVLKLINVAEPEVMVYLDGGNSLRPDVKPDQKVWEALEELEKQKEAAREQTGEGAGRNAAGQGPGENADRNIPGRNAGESTGGNAAGQGPGAGTAYDGFARGVLDAHISSVTGEHVFNIFVRGVLQSGEEIWLVKEYSTREVAERFTLTFYDKTGFSYLVDRSGEIMVRPAHRNSNKTVSGLFDMLDKEGNEEPVVEDFQASIYDLRTGWARFKAGGEQQVFSYEPLKAGSDWLLVSVIPEHMIRAQTNRILRRTMMFSGTAVGLILTLTVIFYGTKMHENQVYTRKLKEALDAADTANRAKGRFLMDMSHDIRTPLNAIIGMTAIARENAADRGRVEDCLDKIQIAGKHLISVVGDILDMSQIEQGTLILQEDSFLLSKIFGEVTGSMARRGQEAGLAMEVVPIQLEHDSVTGDSSRIRQILFNIMDNAVKYTPAGGSVVVELKETGQVLEGRAGYCFRCIDDGIGMEPEFLKRVFLPFERARNTTSSRIAGTGVGLAITKSLLDLMGGTIYVDSAPGKGSAFTVEFSLEVPEQIPETAEDPGTEKEPRDYGDKRVLLVEDNELNMEIAEELVGITGVQVEKAYNGQEAVDMVRESPEGYYDLIFMDIQMPVMDGYEATRQIRGMDREDVGRIPIFALSANALAEDVQNSLEAGMNGHIAKPVDLESIERVLGQVF